MGQSASKAGKAAAEKVAKYQSRAPAAPTATPPAPAAAAATQRPIPPPPTPGPKDVSSNTKANNPAMFLRGTGIAVEDIRDKGQELFLQSVNHLDDEMKAKGPQDMPEDLLKFIQDVGPAKQSVDKDFTAPRLLEKENEMELEKNESARKVRRERIKMPLMDGDDTFTTTRNTNFSKLSTQEETKEFGLSNIQLYQLLMENEKGQPKDLATYYKTVLGEGDDSPNWSEEETNNHLKMLKDAMGAIEIPVLRQDSDGNFYGLYQKDVPGPEVASFQPIPDTKIRLVMQDLALREKLSDEIAIVKLERRRELRKDNRS